MALRKPRIGAIALLALALPLTGCIISIGDDGWHRGWSDWDTQSTWDVDQGRGPRIVGSGALASEEREVPGFHSVDLSGSLELDLVAGAEETALTVHADDNILERLITEVVDGELRVRLERGRYRLENDIRVEVRTPELRVLDSSGSTRCKLSGLTGESLTLDLSGSSEVEASGTVEELEVDVSGSSRLELFGLKSQRAEVSISGAGRVDLSVETELDASISGSGTITYRGAPATSLSVSGSGSIHRDRSAD